MPRRWLVALLALFVAACSNPRDEDLRVCAGVSCTAGTCISDNGKPRCVCGAFDQVAGSICTIDDGHAQPDHPADMPDDGGIEQGGLTTRTDRLDARWYRFDALPLTWYQLSVTTSLPDLQVIDTDGGTWAVNVASPYYFESADGGAAEFGITAADNVDAGYTLSLVPYASDNAGSTLGSAVPLVPGEPVTGTLEIPYDVDMFRFDRGAAPEMFLIECERTDGGGCPGALNPMLSSEAGPGPNQLYVLPSHSSEPGWVALQSDAGEMPSYRVSLSDLGPDPAAAANAPPADVDGGPVVFHQMAPNYPYLATFDAQPLHIYQVDVTGDAGCQVGSSILCEDTAQPEYPVARSTAPSDCALSVSDIGLDDFPSDAGANAPVVTTSSVDVQSQYPTDSDAFVVPASPGQFLQVSCAGPCYVSTLLRGQWIGQVSTSGTLTADVSPTDAGVYAIRVEPWVPWTPVTKTLTFQTITDDYPDPVAVSLGQVMSGSIQALGDEDVFTFASVKGQTYRMNLEASDPNSIQVEYSAGSGTSASNLMNGATFGGSGSTDSFVVRAWEFPHPITYTFSITAAP